MYTLYDVETQIPTFSHITTVSTHDFKTMSEVPYETVSFYIFDHAYNKLSKLFCIHQIGAYFVIRAKKNLQYKVVKWKRRLPKMYSWIASLSLRSTRLQGTIPSNCDWCVSLMRNKDASLFFSRMRLTFLRYWLPNSTRTVGR